MHRLRLFLRPRHEDDPVGLPALVDHLSVQSVPRWATLAEPQLDQAALAGEYLVRQLAAVFAGP